MFHNIIKYTVFTACILFASLIGCMSEDNPKKAIILLNQGKGIESYYYFLKSDKKSITDELQSMIKNSRELTEIELISIFEKPDRYGSKKPYYDNADRHKVIYIIKKDPEFKKKYSRFLKD